MLTSSTWIEAFKSFFRTCEAIEAAMDPLSISAGVIAVLQAATSVGQGLKLLRRLSEAQTFVENLASEISAMKSLCSLMCLAITDLESSLEANNQLPLLAGGIGLLEQALLRSQKALLELDCFVQYRLLTPPALPSSNSRGINKKAWIIERHKLDNLWNNLKAARQDLTQNVTLCDLFRTHRIGQQIEQITAECRMDANERKEDTEKIINAVNRSNETVEGFGARLGSHLQLMQQMIQPHVRCMGTQHALNNSFGSPGGTQTAANLLVTDNSQNTSPRIVISAKPIRPESASCTKRWCTCSCHSSGQLSSPRFLSSILGSMLVTFSDVPQLTPRCNIGSCSTRRRLPLFKINYHFPRWLLSRMITTTLAWSTRDGLDIHRLRAPRIIPTGSAIFNLTQNGDVEGIKSLFVEGTASPYDVDQDGFSALWFTLNNPTPNFLDICQLMIREGADPHEVVANSNGYLPSFETAWALILGKTIDQKDSDILEMMFEDADRLNEFNFSNIHKRVLGLESPTIDNPTTNVSDGVDIVDAFGRTPLHWAIERNDAPAVVTLLEQGADPNLASHRSGWSSMHIAARAGRTHPDIINALLKHGAHPNALDCNKAPPLAWAVRQRNGAATVKALVAAGADPNLQSDDTRWSVAHLAVFLGRHDCVKTLLDVGANFSLKNSLGSNAVLLAAKYGDADMLQVLFGYKEALRHAITECSDLLLQDPEEFRATGHSIVTSEWRVAWRRLMVDDAAFLSRPVLNIASLTDEPEDVFYDAVETVE